MLTLGVNPTRTGEPTRGEKRKTKFLDHLRALRERGKKAEQELKRLTGRGRDTSAPVLTADKTETQLAHPGHYAAELTADQQFLKAQVDEIDRTMADVRDQIRGLGDADEALADELSDQLVKLAKQRAALKAPIVATNPRRRCVLGSRGKRAYSRALRRWCHTLRSNPAGVGMRSAKPGTRRRRR
jgi:chromosome segregation ATPase